MVQMRPYFKAQFDTFCVPIHEIYIDPYTYVKIKIGAFNILFINVSREQRGIDYYFSRITIY